MNAFYEYIFEITGIDTEFVRRILYSVVILSGLSFFRVIVLKIIWKKINDVKSRYIWKRTISYIVLFFSLFLLGSIWFKTFHHVSTFLGLLSAGIAIALKDPLVNLTGWLFLIIRKPFSLGDRIQIGAHQGDVVDIRLFQFTILEIGNWVKADQSTGRLIHVPNGKIFSIEQANFNKGFPYIWDEIRVILTFESNWELAKGILHNIVSNHSAHVSESQAKELQEANSKYLIHYKHLTPKIYVSVESYGIVLTIRYLSEPRKRRTYEHLIWTDILNAFAEDDSITFAYPTQRMVISQFGPDKTDRKDI